MTNADRAGAVSTLHAVASGAIAIQVAPEFTAGEDSVPMKWFRREPTTPISRTHEQWARIGIVIGETDANAGLKLHNLAHPRGYCERPDLLQTLDVPLTIATLIPAAEKEAEVRHLAQIRELQERIAAEGGWMHEPSTPRVITLQGLLALSPSEFEAEVARLLDHHGYRDIRRVGGAGDLGVDIFCVDGLGNRVAVQCKRYARERTIGSPAIQTFFGMVAHHGAHRGLYVTTSGFTEPARLLATQRDIDLIDGPALVQLFAAMER